LNEPYLPLPSQPKLILIYRPHCRQRLRLESEHHWQCTDMCFPGKHYGGGLA